MEVVHAGVVLEAVARMAAEERTIGNLQVAHAELKTMFVAAAVVTECERCLMERAAALHD